MKQKQLLTAAFSLFTTLASFAQNFSTITGQIKDNNGNGVAAATVMLHHAKDSALAKTAVTNSAGNYELLAIKPGNYFISTTVAGMVDATFTHNKALSKACEPHTFKRLVIVRDRVGQPIPGKSAIGCFADLIEAAYAKAQAVAGEIDAIGGVVVEEFPAEDQIEKRRRKGEHAQRQQPGEAGVLNIGGRAGQNLAEDPAAVLDECHRFAAEAAEEPDRHYQRNDDLHAGHAEVAEAGVQAQRQALQPLGEKGADVGHGTRKVTAAHTAPQRHQLECPQRPVLVLQHDAGAQGRGQ